jgi:hypothetical protein
VEAILATVSRPCGLVLRGVSVPWHPLSPRRYRIEKSPVSSQRRALARVSASRIGHRPAPVILIQCLLPFLVVEAREPAAKVQELIRLSSDVGWRAGPRIVSGARYHPCANGIGLHVGQRVYCVLFVHRASMRNEIARRVSPLSSPYSGKLGLGVIVKSPNFP